MDMNGELWRTWKEGVVVYINIPPYYFHSGIGKPVIPLSKVGAFREQNRARDIQNKKQEFQASIWLQATFIALNYTKQGLSLLLPQVGATILLVLSMAGH
jgi:hypothetical protein